MATVEEWNVGTCAIDNIYDILPNILTLMFEVSVRILRMEIFVDKFSSFKLIQVNRGLQIPTKIARQSL